MKRIIISGVRNQSFTTTHFRESILRRGGVPKTFFRRLLDLAPRSTAQFGRLVLRVILSPLGSHDLDQLRHH